MLRKKSGKRPNRNSDKIIHNGRCFCNTMYRQYKKWRMQLLFVIWTFTWLTILIKKEKLTSKDLRPAPVAVRPLPTIKRTTLPTTTTIPVLKDHYLVGQSNQGRLGNHLFRLAAVIGMAYSHGYTPAATRQILSSVTTVFDVKVPVMKPTKDFQKFSEKAAGKFDARILNISHQYNWTLTGYHQSWRYFEKGKDQVRKHYRLKPAILKQANSSLPPRDKLLIGVHVRRGDMNTKQERKRGYNVADEGYLNRSMNYFRNKFGSVRFIVVSDDLAWCRKHLTVPDTKIVRVTREIDLAILTLCDHNIVTSGSFGWWGAWLAGGETVYFDNFPANNTWLAKQYIKSDYYPPHWVGML